MSRKEIELGGWVKYGDEICQVLDVYTQGGKWIYYIFNHADGKSHDVTGGMTIARPRVELRDGTVWKIHHPNPYAKWVGVVMRKLTTSKSVELSIYTGTYILRDTTIVFDRPTAIRALKRLVMRLGISVEVEG